MKFWINVDDGRGPPGETHGPFDTHHEAKAASHAYKVYDYVVGVPNGLVVGTFATEALARDAVAEVPGALIKRRRLTHVHVHGAAE